MAKPTNDSVELARFERLDVFRLAVDINRYAARVSLPSSRRALKDQLVRAADSIVLNIAEGAGHPPGAARLNHFRIASGSAAEVLGGLHCLDRADAKPVMVQARRVLAMLAKLR